MNQAVATLDDLKSKQLAPREANLPPVVTSFFNLQGFELMQRVAKCFASTTLVPTEYRGNVANCLIAINLAQRIGSDPLMVMQHLVIVHGRPTWSAKFLIASVNSCGRFSTLRYEFFGDKNADSYGCRASAIEKSTGEVLTGADITIALAKEEGWYGRNGSKWKTMPQQMLMYRAGAWWTNAFAPEIAVGLATAEEIEDVVDLTSNCDGSYSLSTQAMQQSLQPEIIQQPMQPEPEPAQEPEAEKDVGTEENDAPAPDPIPEMVDPVERAYQHGRTAAAHNLPRDYPRGSNYHYKANHLQAEAFLKGYDEIAAAQGRTTAV